MQNSKPLPLHNSKKPFSVRFRRSLPLFIIFLPPLIWYIVFCYIPMYGIVIAFKDFRGWAGFISFFTKNDWVGFRWFREFFNSVYLTRLIRNTLLINIYGLLWGFPVPIIFALLLNEVRDGLYKRAVQTISYLPYFISTVVICGMVVNFFSPDSGIVNKLLMSAGLVDKPINFLMLPEWFRTIFIGSGIWQGFGFGSIVYLAALAGVDAELYEAAMIDGAGRFKKMWHISLPGITPTIVIYLLLSLGSMMSVGFEKVILLYRPATWEVSDVISTYVYRAGITEARFGLSTAVGFFNSVVNLVLLITFNTISRRVSETSLW